MNSLRERWWFIRRREYLGPLTTQSQSRMIRGRRVRGGPDEDVDVGDRARSLRPGRVCAGAGRRARRAAAHRPHRRLGQFLQPDRQRSRQSGRVLSRRPRPRRAGRAGQCRREPGASQHVRPAGRAAALADRPTAGDANRRRDRRDLEGRGQGARAPRAGQRRVHAHRVRPRHRRDVRAPEVARRAGRDEGRCADRHSRRQPRCRVVVVKDPGRPLRRDRPARSAARDAGAAHGERRGGARAADGGQRGQGAAALSRCARHEGAQRRRVQERPTVNDMLGSDPRAVSRRHARSADHRDSCSS